jgi:predicted DNA-binding transcriptional regulator YafY
MKKEFDPFLSHGQRVKIRLSTKGERILKELATNRPILLSKEGNKFEFECSEEKAKRYFSYFLDEAEILEPIHLREWFKKRHQNALQNYK